VTITKALRLQVLERQGFRCSCGRVITLDAYRLRDWFKILKRYPPPSIPSRAYIHHIKQRSDGGSDRLSNLVGVCGNTHAKVHGYPLRKHFVDL